MAGFVDKFKRMWDAPDDEYEYDEYGYADEGAEEDYKEEPVRNTKKERDLGGGNKVVNINATTNLRLVYSSLSVSAKKPAQLPMSL